MIGILQKIFKHPKIYGYIPISMLFVIVFTILLRFFLPIEFFYTISVWIPFIMNPLNSFVNYSLYGNFQILDLIIIIGVLGMFFPLKGYIKQILHSKRVYSFLVHSAEEKELNDFLNTEMLKIPNYSVYITDKIESPMGIQNHKAIFLPSSIYSNEELEVILLHEIAHIQQKDIYLKHLVNWLLILYWWFPWIKKFQRNVNLFLELKADEYAVNHSTTRNRLFYAKTLLSVKKQIKEKKKIKIAANYLISDSSRLLSTRIEYLAKQPQRKKSSIIILYPLIVMLPLLTNLFIFEAAYPQPPKIEKMYEIEDFKNSYILPNNDGTYTIYFNGESAIITDPANFPEIPIKSSIN